MPRLPLIISSATGLALAERYPPVIRGLPGERATPLRRLSVCGGSAAAAGAGLRAGGTGDTP